jgi:orotate phosphoribosyltransferase
MKVSRPQLSASRKPGFVEDPRRSSRAVRDLQTQVRSLILQFGYERREEPFRLSSGDWSRDYIDGKRALADGHRLALAADCLLAIASELGVGFDAVGGLTMGADPLAHAAAIASGKEWFAVRKEPKPHGRQRLIEGAELRADTRVLLVDDVVTTGTSVFKALTAINESGARVVLVITLVDRGTTAARRLNDEGIPYVPIATYRDLGIDPVAE